MFEASGRLNLSGVTFMMKALTLIAACAASIGFFSTAAKAAPTDGFHTISDSYTVQKPYNLNVSDRFTASGGVYTCWVYGNDKPYSSGTTTAPRTEMRWETFPQQDHDNQFECDAKFDANTTHTCIHQIKSNAGEEPIYLQVNNAGELRNSVGTVFLKNMANTWFHINSIYNPKSGKKALYINGSLKVSGTSPSTQTDFYFKCGVYSNGIASTARSWAQFKNVKHWVK